MPTADENLEAAKLAKLVGSQLNMIDQFHMERRNVPANRINIQKFITQVVNPNQQLVKNDSGYVPEMLVQKMVPDTAQYSKPQDLPQMPNLIPQPAPVPQPPQPNNAVLEPVEAPQQPTQQAHNSTKYQLSETNNNSLERIATAIEKFVDCYVKNNTIDKDEERILNE